MLAAILKQPKLILPLKLTDIRLQPAQAAHNFRKKWAVFKPDCFLCMNMCEVGLLTQANVLIKHGDRSPYESLVFPGAGM